MAVVKELKGVKLTLDLAKGTQTISNCNPSATDEQLNSLGKAVSALCKEETEQIIKVEENVLIEE